MQAQEDERARIAGDLHDSTPTTNIRRHSQASNAIIRVGIRSERVLLIVEDNGRGFEVEKLERHSAGSPSLGVEWMRERAAMLGGEFAVASSAGGGARIRVDLQLGN